VSALGIPALTDIYVQIVQGHTDDALAVRRHYERWFDQIAPDAEGWLHTTAGVTADGEAIAVVRFVSGEAYRRERQRPEQRRWDEQLADSFTEAPTIRDCDRVAAFGDARPDDAGFVQVVQGRAERLRERIGQVASREHHYARAHRLGVLGGLLADHDDDDLGFTELIYYLSAAAARNEEGQLPREGVSMIESYEGHVLDLRYLDLDEPLIRSGGA
jgi:hypothetical protein